MASTPQQLHRGIVKQVLSGDTIIIRGQPRGGPPPERTVCLSNVVAPRLARRANPNIEGSQETKDEPFAWEAREFVRSRLIGKEVTFTVEYKAPGTGREYGCIYMGKDDTADNITELIIAEGLAELRRMGMRANEESQANLIKLEDAAKAAGKGKWGEHPQGTAMRDITWNLDNPMHFVESRNNKPIDAIIEHVRDGCTVRAFLLPSFHYVTVMLSGIKCPMFKMEGDAVRAEPFSEEAKFFTESRLLQREVKIILESASNANLIGSIIHPAGNIAELLLKEGFARCVDWSMGVVSAGPEPLRNAEKSAKEKKIRMWKDYKPSENAVEFDREMYTAKVIEVINGDALSIKMNDGTFKKIFLSSIRPPRAQAESPDEPKRDARVRTRPLYDVPYLFEAREFLRKKLVGKKVNIRTDYIQPQSENFPEKVCCTVVANNVNVAEALISKGLGTVIRYRQDDDQRSSAYDALLAAEVRAQKKGVGVHSKKEAPLHRVADVSGDVNKAKQFFPSLQRAGKLDALVEFVASGSRMRLYIPKETCLITFLLSGIDCPRGSRPGPGGVMTPADPHGEEAMSFSKEQCLQREVVISVEAMDKGGNYIGWMFVEGKNLSLALVEDGFAAVHFTAERTEYYKALTDAEARAKSRNQRRWANYEEPKREIETEVEPKERKKDYKDVLVTVVTDDGTFFAQMASNAKQLESLMEQLRSELSTNPPVTGAYTPKKGDLCAAKYVDKEWYRAKVESVNASGVNILYIDYGNREKTTVMNLAPLPALFKTMPAQSTEYRFACVAFPEDEEYKQEAVDQLYNDIENQRFMLNIEYRNGNDTFVTLKPKEGDGGDPALALVSEGYVLAEHRREKHLREISDSYVKAQDQAKKNRSNLWRYGDFTEDQAKEFGYSK